MENLSLRRLRINLVVAVCKSNNGIGINNDLPWKIRSAFKQISMRIRLFNDANESCCSAHFIKLSKTGKKFEQQHKAALTNRTMPRDLLKRIECAKMLLESKIIHFASNHADQFIIIIKQYYLPSKQ